MNLERDFSTNTSEKALTSLNSFSEVKQREERVERFEAVQEKIAIFFVAKYYKSVILIAVINPQLRSGLEKFIASYKNID